MTNSDKPNNVFCAWKIAKFSDLFFKHNKEHNSNIKKDKLAEFRRIACWMSGKLY